MKGMLLWMIRALALAGLLGWGGTWAGAAPHPAGAAQVRPQALLHRAIVALNRSDYPAALALTQRAWSLARQQHNRRQEWAAINYLVEISQTHNELAAALAYARQALAVAQAVGNDTLITASCISMGATLDESAQHRAATPYLRRALAGVRRQRKYLQTSHVLVNLAWNAVDLTDLPGARGYANEAVSIARQRANRLALCNALDARAYVLMEQGQPVAAVADMEEALRVAQASGDMKNILYVRSSMPALYEKAGRLADALAAERRHTALTDSLNSAEVQRRMVELSARFGVRQQHDSIASLQQQRRIAALGTAQARAQARLWGAAAVGLAVLLVAGGGCCDRCAARGPNWRLRRQSCGPPTP